jgi:phage gpG-like protein
MAGVAIRVQLDTRQLEERLGAIGEAFHPRGLLLAIGESTIRWIDENFETDGGKVGGWDPLSPNTVAGRRKGSSRPLQDTGNLRESFTYELEGDGAVRVGTAVEYASQHQEGIGPYQIEARGRALAFMTTGGMIFVKRVSHPGIPQRRMVPNEDEGEDIARGMIEARLEQIDGEG